MRNFENQLLESEATAHASSRRAANLVVGRHLLDPSTLSWRFGSEGGLGLATVR
jgi:hypothetical protein